jgi:D-tyrosyl-tRNA(Tyr) deacylase
MAGYRIYVDGTLDRTVSAATRSTRTAHRAGNVRNTTTGGGSPRGGHGMTQE